MYGHVLEELNQWMFAKIRTKIICHFWVTIIHNFGNKYSFCCCNISLTKTDTTVRRV